MAAHSVVVGRLLGSSFFMLVFFWGWVAAAAYRGRLDSAKSMAVVMTAIMLGTAVATAFLPGSAPADIAYYAFALYPALVSWACVFVYVRHLQQRDSTARPAKRARPTPRRLVQNGAGITVRG